MKVMIVEDNKNMREMIKQIIIKSVDGVASISECSNGQEAIERYDQVRPDWILMDIQMEPIDGLTASRIIKNSHPKARIIIVTSYDDAMYREAARDAGVEAYVLKENLWKISELMAA